MSSALMQATRRASPKGLSSGAASAQRAIAWAQRVRKTQPELRPFGDARRVACIRAEDIG